MFKKWSDQIIYIEFCHIIYILFNCSFRISIDPRHGFPKDSPVKADEVKRFSVYKIPDGEEGLLTTNERRNSNSQFHGPVMPNGPIFQEGSMGPSGLMGISKRIYRDLATGQILHLVHPVEIGITELAAGQQGVMRPYGPIVPLNRWSTAQVRPNEASGPWLTGIGNLPRLEPATKYPYLIPNNRFQPHVSPSQSTNPLKPNRNYVPVSLEQYHNLQPSRNHMSFSPPTQPLRYPAVTYAPPTQHPKGFNPLYNYAMEEQLHGIV